MLKSSLFSAALILAVSSSAIGMEDDPLQPRAIRIGVTSKAINLLSPTGKDLPRLHTLLEQAKDDDDALNELERRLAELRMDENRRTFSSKVHDYLQQLTREGSRGNQGDQWYAHFEDVVAAQEELIKVSSSLSSSWAEYLRTLVPSSGTEASKMWKRDFNAALTRYQAYNTEKGLLKSHRDYLVSILPSSYNKEPFEKWQEVFDRALERYQVYNAAEGLLQAHRDYLASILPSSHNQNPFENWEEAFDRALERYQAYNAKKGRLLKSQQDYLMSILPSSYNMNPVEKWQEAFDRTLERYQVYNAEEGLLRSQRDYLVSILPSPYSMNPVENWQEAFDWALERYKVYNAQKGLLLQSQQDYLASILPVTSKKPIEGWAETFDAVLGAYQAYNDLTKDLPSLLKENYLLKCLPPYSDNGFQSEKFYNGVKISSFLTTPQEKFKESDNARVEEFRKRLSAEEVRWKRGVKNDLNSLFIAFESLGDIRLQS